MAKTRRVEPGIVILLSYSVDRYQVGEDACEPSITTHRVSGYPSYCIDLCVVCSINLTVSHRQDRPENRKLNELPRKATGYRDRSELGSWASSAFLQRLGT